MAESSRHGPEHPAHLHTAFEDPDVQAAAGVGSGDLSVVDTAAPRGLAHQQYRPPRHADTLPAVHQRRRQHRHQSQPQASTSLRTRAGALPAASSSSHRHPSHHRHQHRAARPDGSASASPSPTGSLSLSLSPSARLSSSSGPSASSARRGMAPAALDGAALAAACAAAPINPAPSHRSYAPSTHRGLRRCDDSSGALNNIHPDILDDLRALDDLEGGALLRPLLTQPPGPDDDGGGSRGPGGDGWGEDGEGRGDGGEGGGHVDEAETYEVQELLEAKPRDVLQFIEEEGVVKLTEFEVADGLVLKAFGSEPFLVMGHEHAEPPGLRDMWMERLGEAGKVQGTGWTSSLSVEAHVVNLYDAAAPGLAGLLRPLLARLRVHGCPPTVFALPALQAVIALKWNTWARHFLFAEFVFYAIWLAAFSAFSLLLEDGADPADGGDGGGGSLPVVRLLSSIVQAVTVALRADGGTLPYSLSAAATTDDDGCGARFLNPWDWGSLGSLLASPRGFAQLATSTLAVAAMMPFAYMEVCTLMVQGLAWVNLFNLADVASYFLAAALWASHLRCGSLPRSSWFSGALALQHVLLWTKLHYYARVLTPTRGGFNDTIRMVLSELRTFLTFVGLVMMGFAFAFYCLFRQDRDEFADFSTLWHSFASMFAYMLQMFDYSVLYNSTHPVLAMVLFMAYELMVAVLLLNIMIALMTSAFARVSADEGLRYLIYKAEVIDELESTLPRWLMRPNWFPHFVHVLKISPRSTYEINLNSVWSGMSTLQSSLMNAQQETRLRVEALESKMDVIDQKLSATVRLLASRLLTHNELAAALSMDDVAEASDSEAQDLDLDGEDGEPDPEHWRDADLDPRPDEQAVPEAPEDEEDAVALALSAARGAGGAGGLGMRRGGSGSNRGGVGGQQQQYFHPHPHPHQYPHRPQHYYPHQQHPPRRFQSSQVQFQHHSSHPSHATSTQLPGRHHGHSHGHSHGHGHSTHTTHGSLGPSAHASHAPSRDPSVPHSTSPHHARTAAPAATGGARLHAFYSHGHGQNYHGQQQQQQINEAAERLPYPRGSATPPPVAGGTPGRSHQHQQGPAAAGTETPGRGGGGAASVRPGTAPAATPTAAYEKYDGRPSSPGGGDGTPGVGYGRRRSGESTAAAAAAAAAAGHDGAVPEGAVVLDMRRSEDRTAAAAAAAAPLPLSPSGTLWSGLFPTAAVTPPPRDDAVARAARQYQTSRHGGGGSGQLQGRQPSPGRAPGATGGGGGGGMGPAMASIAENGSPSLAGSEVLTDGSLMRWSPGGNGGSDAGSGPRGG